MRRFGPSALLALTGAAVLRVSLFSELYLRYVQAGLRPYLIVSGAVLVLLAAASAVARRTEAADDGHGHAHGPAGPRVARLLTLPALALLLFPPPALGTYSAEREAAARAAQGVGTFPALPSGDPVELTLAEFSSRAIYDSGRSLAGRTVRLTGFVTRDDDGTWYVTRLLVTCCAADATTGKAEVRGVAAAGAPADGAWVTVTGTWHPEGGLGTDAAWPPVVDADRVRRTTQPANPYERP
ncbi:TIGR03943 family putative permease subunit [Streptomyces daghestanicus]|uniref:Membrane protein n=1 Tax=Streptomyces daghestanicus TaxID=66885 RepID=A0ABQ3Q5U4_9ACTN|nr:TIGR03943 family protein [Streptomyces daghestanicus]GGU61100.1 membrane protein [Streptomyces daghestanicus]GHI32669.1 membrane protein [Streptomyces daghestanicus]